MVPLPAQGHLNQLLQLSRLVTAHGIPVHYVCTATHIRHAKLRAHGWDPLAAANLKFHELPIPPFQSPNPDSNTAGTKFPSHLQPLFVVASSHLREPLTSLLHSLSRTARRVVVIHDSLMSSVVQDVVTIPNAESYIFHSVSAFSIFWYFWDGLTEKPFPVEDGVLDEIPSLEDCFTPEFMEFILSEMKYHGLCSGYIYNACRVVEEKYIDLIEKLSESGGEKIKHWAVGPFNPVEVTKEDKPVVTHECLKWLDKQEPKSVLFVSFGTTTSLPDEQIQELAIGLEQSEVKFIWVLRDADRGDLVCGEARKLLEGFEERVGEQGIIVRDWAPQLLILGHSSTGGFLTHCGWNSCMESFSMGVPVATWPMHSDQPRNAVLMTGVSRVGVVVKDWKERDKTVTAETVSKALRRLMGSEEGEEIRRRVEELGGGVRGAVAEGGVSRLEMESFIAHINR